MLLVNKLLDAVRIFGFFTYPDKLSLRWTLGIHAYIELTTIFPFLAKEMGVVRTAGSRRLVDGHWVKYIPKYYFSYPPCIFTMRTGLILKFVFPRILGL